MHMANSLITESETEQILEALNPSKATTYNGLFPKALKTLSPYIAPTLSHIIYLSLQISQSPSG